MKKPTFDFGDLFGGKRRKLEVKPMDDSNAPPEIKNLSLALNKIQPMLIDFVRVTRAIPGVEKMLDIGLLVDGKPCNFHFKDNFMPDIIKEMEKGGAPRNLPVEVRVPKEDMVASIEGLLRQMYPMVIDQDVLGAIWSPHHNAAMKLAEILEKARDRDRKFIAQEISKMLDSFKY